MGKNTRRVHLKLEQLKEKTAQQYITWMQQQKYASSSLRRTFQAIQVFQDLGDTSLLEATRDDLDAHHLKLIKRDLAPSTIMQQMASLRTFYNWLEKQGHIFLNPAADLLLRRPPKTISYVPGVDDVRKLMAAPKTHTRGGLRDRAFMEVMYSTGARLVEMASMSIFDVDLARGSIKIHYGKGRKQRVVPLGKKAIRWLENYIRLRHRLLNNDPDEEALWLNVCGDPLSYQGAEKIVHRNTLAAGIHPFSGHALRRACATHMLRNGAHPVQLQMLLGHSSLKYLSQYLNVSVSDLKKMHEQSRPGR